MNQWREAGISEGDTVLIHSSLKRTFQQLGGTVSSILDSFIDAVGDTGTLLLPLFNFDFTKGVPFDMRTTPSQMGILTEAGRLYQEAIRTGHPIYSFAVLGANQSRFNVDNFSGYGADSPFGILRELDGKIAVLNLPDSHSMTFYHHVEEMNQVDYRFMKLFTGQYTDMAGKTELRTYGLYVRYPHVTTHVNPCGELAWDAGLYTGCRPDEGCGLRVIKANDLYKLVTDVIQSGRAKGMLYV